MRNHQINFDSTDNQNNIACIIKIFLSQCLSHLCSLCVGHIYKKSSGGGGGGGRRQKLPLLIQISTFCEAGTNPERDNTKTVLVDVNEVSADGGSLD